MKYWKVWISRLIEWFRYYFFFSKAVLLISGLVFSHSLVEHAVVDVLMSYITDPDVKEEVNLSIAAAVVNMQQVTTAIATILIAFITDAYFGHFKMILFTTATYVVGLTLLWIANAGTWLFLIALLLMSVGQAGKEPPLKEFLAYQLRDKKQSRNDQNENKVGGQEPPLKKFPAEDQVREQEKGLNDKLENHVEGQEPPLMKNQDDRSRDHDESLDDKHEIQTPADTLEGQEQNQLDGKNNNKVETRTEIWWRFWWCLGSITATFAFPDDWVIIFKITAVVMLAAYWLFRSGEALYYKKATGSPLSLAYRVLKAAIMKRRLPYPGAASLFFKNDGDEVILLPNIPFFRWLDKAAIVDPSFLSPEEHEMQGKLCSVAQVKEIKSLLKMVPMWATFLVYGVVESTGSTFFILQTSNLSSPIVNSFVDIVIAFNVMTSFTSFILSYLYELLIQRRWSDGRQKQGGLLVRIGVGMVSSVLCCCAAWLVEVRRLSMVEMSILWLVPQFLLSGLMEELAEDGLEDFFCVEVADQSMESYGGPFTKGILSIGKFVNTLCIFIFKDWFSENANTSTHLSKYYRMLTILSSGNLCFYFYVSYWYMRGEGEAVRVHPSTTSDDGHQDSVTTSHPSNGSQSTTQSSLLQTTRSLSLRRSKTFEVYGGV
ncbi:hypothetical protein PVL29_010414 [Vitis rotundifolia]|uniref:Uncharacterized protein n=1 Tax=Vitis rotundifolia TaxID=103349 RepID=A0AA38ZU33_VITRO|nr:hypothetical protein PVL29_010414 [Vitis rotundifolia]